MYGSGTNAKIDVSLRQERNRTILIGSLDQHKCSMFHVMFKNVLLEACAALHSGLQGKLMTRKYVHYHYRRFMVFVFAGIVLISCASTFTVKEEERDRASIYKGFWSSAISDTPSESLAGSYRTGCYDLDSIGNLQIAGGRVVARVIGYDLAGFINSSGKFSAYIELSGNSQFRLRGQLDSVTGKGEGRITLNRKSQGLAGCTSKVAFEKLDL